MNPANIPVKSDGHAAPPAQSPPVQSSPFAPSYRNEPPADFSREEARQAMRAALEDVADQFDGEYPLVIGGQQVTTTEWIASPCPSHKARTVGRCASAEVEHADAAVEAAQRALAEWCKSGAERRAEYLRTRGRDHAPPPLRAVGLGSLRMCQGVARSGRRRLRGDRLLRVLRRRRDRLGAAARRRRARRGKPLRVRAARRDGRDRPLEFSARDSHRHDHRGPGHRQHRGDEAGRTVERRGRQAHGNLSRGRAARRRGQLSAWPGRNGRRGAGRAPAGGRDRVHRFARGGAGDQRQGGRSFGPADGSSSSST